MERGLFRPSSPQRIGLNLFLFAIVTLTIGCDDSLRPVVVAEVQLESPADYLDVGQQLDVRARVVDRSGTVTHAPGLIWTSSDSAIAMVADGQVTGQAPGEVYIKVAVGTQADSVRLIVERPVAELLVWPADTVRLLQGRSIPLLVEMLDSAGSSTTHSLFLSSADPAVAAVEDARVIAGALGRTVVTVRAGAKAVRVPIQIVTGARYVAEPLGKLSSSPYASLWAYDLNNLGWVVGRGSLTRGGDGPFLYRGGNLEEIVISTAQTDGAAQAVNDRGQIALRVHAARRSEAWLWESGDLVPIHPPGELHPNCPLTHLRPVDMTKDAEVVLTIACGPYREHFGIFVWQGGTARWIESDTTWFYDKPIEIAADGTVLVHTRDGYALWRNGQLRPAPSPSSGRHWVPRGINSRGDLFGTVDINRERRLAIGSSAGFRIYEQSPPPPVLPVDMNAFGDVVGGVPADSPGVPGGIFVLRDGQLYDVNQMVTGWHVTGVFAMNDVGQIAVGAYHRVTGRSEVLLLSPTD